MRLVVDTSVLVGELLRQKGRARLGDARLELFLPEQMWAETQVELPRRVQAFVRRRSSEPVLAPELARLCLDAIEANVVVLDDHDFLGVGVATWTTGSLQAWLDRS